MSGSVLDLKPDDVQKLLISQAHIGSSMVNFQMEQYMYNRNAKGIFIINLKRTWEKLVLAARAIAAVENPADVCVISARPYAQRAILKFASYTGATAVAGRFTPGTFTNQIQAAFREPRLLVVNDPRVDHQPITEASYVNIPVIAFCNSESPLRFIDIAIPCNNKERNSIGLMWWLLAREVLRIRGNISRETPWSVMVDLFFYRDPEEQEKEMEQRALEKTGKGDFEPSFIETPVTQPTTVDEVAAPEAIKTAAAPGNEDWNANNWNAPNDSSWGGSGWN